MNKKRVFQKYLAEQLVELGNRIVRIEDDLHRPGLLVYTFEDTLKFREDFHNFVKNK